MREFCKSGSVGARGGQPPWATRRGRLLQKRERSLGMLVRAGRIAQGILPPPQCDMAGATCYIRHLRTSPASRSRQDIGPSARRRQLVFYAFPVWLGGKE